MHLKNLHEYEEDDNNNYKNNNSYALKSEMQKRPLSRSSYNNNNLQQKNYMNKNRGDQNLKHMPDHLASKFVNDILNSKFSEGD